MFIRVCAFSIVNFSGPGRVLCYLGGEGREGGSTHTTFKRKETSGGNEVSDVALRASFL